MRSRQKQHVVRLILLVLVVAGGGIYGYGRFHKGGETKPETSFATPEENANVNVRFDMEGYDLIQKNYWQKADDANLANLFQLSVQKAAASSTVPLPAPTRAGVATMLGRVMASATSTEAQQQIAVLTMQVALYNMAPTGRNQLMSQVQQKQLMNEVTNVNPEKNLYKDLGVADLAPPQVVAQAVAEKEKVATTTAQKKALAYTKEVLTTPSKKARYDQARVEPSVFTHVYGRTLYLYLSQMTPTTAQEFAEAVDTASTTPGLSSMIIDLRGNIGGALDFSQYFLGFFQGQSQYAFDLFHLGDYVVQRTVTGKLPALARYEETAVLADGMTQSTAEVTTAAMKRLHLAHVVGATTRGWGSVEATYPMKTAIDPSTTYSVLMVSYLTLRDDNQPVEGKGVDPDVAIADKNWRSKLSTYFTSPSLISAIEQTVTKPPQK